MFKNNLPAIFIIFTFIFFLNMPNSTLLSCTMFTINNNHTILVGNNEDDNTLFTEIWVVPATANKYGCLYLAFKDKQGIQSAMNEKGLIFDIFMAPRLKVLKSKQKKVCDGNLLYTKVMETCGSIDDVLTKLDSYNLEFLEQAQLMFVDATGDWVIVEGDEIIRNRKKCDFQVITNFYHSKLKKGEKFPCLRYQTAHDMLSKYQNEDNLTIKTSVKIMAAVHQEWRMGGTLYSNIYDLKRRLIYLYHYHNFENVVILDLNQELKKGKRKIALPSLFPKTFAAEQYKKSYIAGSREAINMDPEISDRYLGEYQYESGRRIKIIKEKRIFYIGRKETKYEILPESENKFFFKNYDILLTFKKDKSGKVTDLILHFEKDRKAKKLK